MNSSVSSPGATAIVVLVHDEATRLVAGEAVAAVARCLMAKNTAEADAMLRDPSVGVLVVEDELPGETGIMFLARINHQHPWLRRVLICGPLAPTLLIHLINEANVFRCLPKPIRSAEFKVILSRAVDDHLRARQLAASAAESERLRAELASTAHRLGRFKVGLSAWIAALPRIFALALLGAAWILVLGIVVLFALYCLKTFMGIDFFEGFHLHDLFR